MQINRHTYEEYFLLYTDEELNAEERAAVEKFVEEHPELKEELEILGQSVFIPDENIVFGNKEVLYKEEKDRAAVVFFGWRKIAAAAAVLLFLSGGWLYLNKKTPAAGHEIVKTRPAPQPSTRNQQAQTARDTKSTQIPVAEQPLIVKVSSNKNKKNNPAKRLMQKHALKNTAGEQVANNDKKPDEAIALRETPDIVHDVATVNNPKGKINIPVQGRDIASSEPIPVQTTIHYADEENLSGDNKIYFANTSFSKKNNLRVVFRKASRIIDRITTLQ